MIIQPYIFFISLAVGLFFVYILSPPPQVVMKFPTPYNAGKVKYKDNNDTCYVYSATKSECPKDKSLIRPQPIFEDFSQKKNVNV
jgi:hypothetical protein